MYFILFEQGINWIYHLALETYSGLFFLKELKGNDKDMTFSEDLFGVAGCQLIGQTRKIEFYIHLWIRSNQIKIFRLAKSSLTFDHIFSSKRKKNRIYCKRAVATQDHVGE